MIYVATHNNVASWGQKSIDSMKAATLGEDVQVVIQQTTPEGTTRIHIQDGHTSESCMGGDVDSGDADTLVAFAKWGKGVAPSDRYALVLWSHGSGWEPAEIQGIKLERSVSEPVTGEELRERSVDSAGFHIFFTPSMRTIVGQDTISERDIAFDNGTGHSLDTVELGKALDAIKDELGQPVNLLGMNACLMATVEVLYEVRDAADVYVASEELMPAESWPYKEILTQLGQTPQMDEVELGKLIVARYTAAFQDDSAEQMAARHINGTTLTAVRVGRVKELAAAVKTLAQRLSDDIDQQFGPIWQAQRATVQFQNSHRSYHLYDLGMFCQNLAAARGVSETVKEGAEAVVTLLKDEDFILAEAHSAEEDAGIMGLTTYLMEPLNKKGLSQFYSQVAYAQETEWDLFLEDYFDAFKNVD